MMKATSSMAASRAKAVWISSGVSSRLDQRARTRAPMEPLVPPAMAAQTSSAAGWAWKVIDTISPTMARQEAMMKGIMKRWP